jgi:hypothetical protein
MSHIVFLLEERSAEELLKNLLPRILPADVICRYLVFEGKQDLEKRLERSIRRYMVPDARFIVLRDQDGGDCKIIKNRLQEICAHLEKTIIFRIACREIESWYLAQLDAVEKAMACRGLAKFQLKEKYRQPDRLSSPSNELKVLTGGRYQKIQSSRIIGLHLNPDCDRSVSFKNLIRAIKTVGSI